MKIPTSFKSPIIKSNSGVTLIELTVVILVTLTLIAVLFIAAGSYKRAADRAGCAVIQDKIRKLLTSERNLNERTFEPNVDYFADPDYLNVITEEGVACPSAGTYTAILGPDGQRLQIECTVHGNLLD